MLLIMYVTTLADHAIALLGASVERAYEAA